MKVVHANGKTNSQEEKKPITDEEEEKMWKAEVLGDKTAKSLMNTVYFYNGKLFGLRASEHRLLRLRDLDIGAEYIIYRENASKTFHGGIADLKKKARSVKHLCHPAGKEHTKRCLVQIYTRYIECVKGLRASDGAFYLQPRLDKYAFKNSPVGIHSLAKIVPELCAAINVPRKTSHCLRVTCVTKLFNANVDEKLIRDRSGHTSNALFVYEKASEKQQQLVSNILAPKEESESAKPSTPTRYLENKYSEEEPCWDIELDECFSVKECNECPPANVEGRGGGYNYAMKGPTTVIKNCHVTLNQFK